MKKAKETINKDRLKKVVINGFPYYFDDWKNILYTEDLKSFTTLKHLTSQEQHQLRNQLNYSN